MKRTKLAKTLNKDIQTEIYETYKQLGVSEDEFFKLMEMPKKEALKYLNKCKQKSRKKITKLTKEIRDKEKNNPTNGRYKEPKKGDKSICCHCKRLITFNGDMWIEDHESLTHPHHAQPPYFTV